MENNTGATQALEEIVEALRNKSPKELLSYAIFNEEDEAEYYAELARRVSMVSVKVLFLKMSEESNNHREWLYHLFKKLYPNEEPVKVEAPPVEVAPFLQEFETVDDYVSALEYCMESELFAKKTYEILAKVAEDEDTRALALHLATMEEEHYHEIRRLYELITLMKERDINPPHLDPGGYLFTDDTKAKYFLLDMLDSNRVLKALVRENPEQFMKLFEGKDASAVWVTKTGAENSIPPSGVPTLRKDLFRFFEKASRDGKQGIVFIQNFGYLVLELGFKDAIDFALYLKDSALHYNGYVVMTAVPTAFEKKEWSLLTSEFVEIS
ncbi:DUF835 domain-containing protein [Thermococcus pacificus]|uniref:Rubrerythrin n=1 Tax=Thermococcus pacificus TaxID=71998 RepID=A0A218P9C9_9EURY|nr:DUF835 domain-containing protein [Thermococcus pacificus]ASJ07395.1 rubrerythrin [Thermococcus pacificus]